MAEITTDIPVYSGDIPDPNEQSQAEFDINAVAWNGYVKSLAPAQNAQASEANALRADLNSIRNTAISETSALKAQAEQAREESRSASNIAQASANFKGEWTTLFGPLSPPASVWHAESYWLLLRPLDNVSASEPIASSADWSPLQTLSVVRQPTPISPLNGASAVVTSPELSAAEYANVYASDVRDYRRFEVDVQGGDWSSPLYVFEGNVDAQTLDIELDTLSSYQWRCRDVSAAGVTSHWSATQVFSTADIYIQAPTITDPASDAMDVGETPTITTSAFSVANGGADTHLNTDWQILDNDTLLAAWESLSDAANKTSISVPAEHLSEATEYRIRARHRGEIYGESAWGQVIVNTAESFVSVVTPTLLHPSTGDPWGNLYVQGSQFAADGSKALHVATKIEVFEGAVLVYENEKTGSFDPSVTAGTDQIGTLDDTATHVSASDASADTWKLFDGDDTTYWQITGSSAWVQIEPQTERNPYLTGVNLTIRNTVSAPDQAPETLRLQGSLDGLTWMDLETWSGLTWTAGETKSLSVGTVSGTGYPYIRLQIDANNGHSTTELAGVEVLSHTAMNPLEYIGDSDVTASLTPSTDYAVRIGYQMAGDTEYTWSEEQAVTTDSSLVVPEVIGLVCVSTGGGAGTWQRIGEDFEDIATDASYFSNHSVYAGIEHELIDGQYMGKIPKFWFRAGSVPSGTYAGKTYWQISGVPLAGLAEHPAFADGAGGWRDQIWIADYQGTDDGGTKLGSQPGVLPLVNLDFPTMQARAAARNTGGVTGFSLWSYHLLGALQMLATIEIGGADSQSLIGQGRVNASSAANTDAADVAEATWRGFVGLWGNVWQMVDGLKRNSSKWWLWTPGTNTYVDSGQADLQTSGYPVTMNNPLLDSNGVLLPATINATNTNGSTGDYFYSNATTTDIIAYHGGYWGDGANAGLLCLYVSSAPSSGTTYRGARLAKV